MGLIMQLPAIIEESRRALEGLLAEEKGSDFLAVESVGYGGPGRAADRESHRAPTGWAEAADEPQNLIVHGENAAFMKYLLKQRAMAGKFQLIYIDPPFFTKTDYGAEIKLQSDKLSKIPAMKQKAYPDTWERGMEEYLRTMALRFLLMKELLAEEGALWVHVDWHAVHYLKVILDEIFGEKNFINEVIWQYKSGGVSKRYFARKHDTLLFYAKSPKYYFQPAQEKSYNRGYKPYRFRGVKEYRDELGWYTMVNRKDVWQLDMVGRTSVERTGYVTQKPEALIRRILESCTKEGDLCGDFFGGSGTMAAAAADLGRRWVSCDLGRLATVNALKRLTEKGGEFVLLEEVARPETANAGEKTAPEEKSKAGTGIFHADITLQPSAISTTMELKVKLLDYRPVSLENLPVEARYLPEIESLLKQDSLQFVDYWSVDCHYNGRLHRPEVCFCKGKDRVQDTWETIGADLGPISVRVVDIFGNSGFLVKED